MIVYIELYEQQYDDDADVLLNGTGKYAVPSTRFGTFSSTSATYSVQNVQLGNETITKQTQKCEEREFEAQTPVPQDRKSVV